MEAFQNLFDQLGIIGDVNLVVKDNNYEAIQFGEFFRSFCEELELEEKVVREHIWDYALYEVYRECCTFNSEDLDLLESLDEEDVNGITLGDILDEKYCISPESYYESFGYLLNDKNDQFTKAKEREKIIQSIQDTSMIKSRHFEYILKEVTFFNVYKDKLKRHQQPFNKAADKLNGVKDIEKFKNNTLFFLRQLGKANNINYTYDLECFEKSANLLFIFSLYACVEKNQHAFDNEKKEEYYFNTLSSLVVIENIELKLYILKTLIEKEVLFTYKKLEFNLLLHRITILSVLYPLLIKEFIVQNLIITDKNIGVTASNKVDEFLSDAKVKKLKEKAFVFELLKNHKGYNLNKLADAFESIEVKNVKLFENLYTRVSSLQVIKSESMDQFKLDLYESMDTFNQIESLSNHNILAILEGLLIEMQNKVTSKWRSIRKK
ncbi:hypothetical protein D3H55_15065 [Bacillus salacetis]|uniref:Uncharacterized protein n=1 Tax=Bacillus salacetis TaxID=2315464 RepID=A0A3A1QXZ9_9BACI|nr:hypothetical protein [Bacillus salacetis]RIW31612.1 hypothetical protein D3H55_15065 [Bacillus salacetis]